MFTTAFAPLQRFCMNTVCFIANITLLSLIVSTILVISGLIKDANEYLQPRKISKEEPRIVSEIK